MAEKMNPSTRQIRYMIVYFTLDASKRISKYFFVPCKKMKLPMSTIEPKEKRLTKVFGFKKIVRTKKQLKAMRPQPTQSKMKKIFRSLSTSKALISLFFILSR